MRRLIVMWTGIAALAATAVVAATDASTGARWPLLLTRAALAFGIVALAGWIVGFVLMRTALRRHYEQGRMAHAESRPRAHR